MQIHELNNFTGNLDGNAFVAIDNGFDTGKVPYSELMQNVNDDIDAVNTRIDNIVTSPAPTEQEIIDARLGADGTTYASLGDAIREQIDSVNNGIMAEEIILKSASDFSGYNATVQQNGNSVVATKGAASNWYALGVKNRGLKFNAGNVEYIPVAIGTSANAPSYIFILAFVNNSSSNFGKAYVFAYNKNTSVVGTDRAEYTKQILSSSAVYGANAEIEIEFSGTNATISYNGIQNTFDISTVLITTLGTDYFETPYTGAICHSSIHGNSYNFTFETVINEIMNTISGYGRWSGKTWCSFGDSITGYDYYQPLVKNALKLTNYTNMGVGGSSIAEQYAGQSAAFCNRYATIAGGYDIITIMGGTNDFGKDIPLGTKGNGDKTTFYGGLEALLSGIKTSFPTTPILFYTPLQRDYFGTSQEISGMTNGNGNTLREYRDIIIDCCIDAGIPVFDLYGAGGLYPENVHNWTIDGLHPNATYWAYHYQLISDFMVNYLPTT